MVALSSRQIFQADEIAMLKANRRRRITLKHLINHKTLPIGGVFIF